MFKVGDRVYAIINDRYGVTRDGWTGTVKGVVTPFIDDSDILVADDEGNDEFWVCSKYFRPVSERISLN